MKYKWLLIILFLFIKYQLCTNTNGFLYSGIKINIISLCIFIIFSIIPFHKMSKRIEYFIKRISIYTPGIYYIHFPIMYYLNNYIILIKKNTLYGTIIIYIFSYFICFIGDKLLGKTMLMHLFK